MNVIIKDDDRRAREAYVQRSYHVYGNATPEEREACEIISERSKEVGDQIDREASRRSWS